MWSLLVLFFYYVFHHSYMKARIGLLNLKHLQKSSLLQTENKIIKDITDEQYELLQSLDEGIVVIENKDIKYYNDLFSNIVDRSNSQLNGNEQELVKAKIFRLYRETKDRQSGNIFNKKLVEDQTLSLRQMLGYT